MVVVANIMQIKFREACTKLVGIIKVFRRRCWESSHTWNRVKWVKVRDMWGLSIRIVSKWVIDGVIIEYLNHWLHREFNQVTNMIRKSCSYFISMDNVGSRGGRRWIRLSYDNRGRSFEWGWRFMTVLLCRIFDNVLDLVGCFHIKNLQRH